jgi:hypothetical protein
MSTSENFSEQVRECIRQSGKTCYRISQDSEIDPAVLSRFMNCKGWLAIETIDALAKAIGMRATLVAATKTTKKTKRAPRREAPSKR